MESRPLLLRGNRQLHRKIDRAGFVFLILVFLFPPAIWPLAASSYAQSVRGGSTNNFHYSGAHSDNFYVLFSSDIFRLSQRDPHFTNFTNSSSKNDRAIAPSLTLTYPERCASKLCVRTCQKLIRIFHLRPNRDEKVAKKRLQN